MEKTVPAEIIEGKIALLRGQKVMLSQDLAVLYGVEPRTLIQAVKRNAERFPADFMFQLSEQESQHFSRSQIVILKNGRGHNVKYRPYAFTEQGVAMLSSVLRSERAVQVNIAIMRAFVKLRRMIASNEVLAKRLDELEARYDLRFKAVFDAIRALMEPPVPPRRIIGFGPGQVSRR